MTNQERIALLRKAKSELKLTKEGFKPDRPHWQNAIGYLNKLEASLKTPPKRNRVPPLGSILRGHKSVLLYACTHYTDGVGWPAFDQQDDPGTDVIAPEDIIIYDNTSGAQGGDAFYCRGASSMLYWIGHISWVPSQGARFKKGQKITEVSRDHPVPHVHLAINATPLIGHHLISRHDYAPGAPLIGVQLARALNS